jgi:hypothetical protein
MDKLTGLAGFRAGKAKMTKMGSLARRRILRNS